MANTEVRTKIKPNLKISEPSLYKVVYINDDVTTMEFVVQSLMEVFGYAVDVAINICEKIHQNGSAVVAVLPYEIAEQRGIEVTQAARSNGFPLQIKLEANE